MTKTDSPPEPAAAAGTALLLCKDAPTRQLILESLHPLAILPEICEEGSIAASLLDKQKFEAVIVDLVRRRYFRCPVAIPAFVRARQPEDLLCQTVNISEGGIAIDAPAVLEPNCSALVRFSLPGRTSQLFAETKVVWRGQSSMVGLEFQALAAPQKSELQEWLARKLDETLPENVAALFRSVGQS